MKSLKDWAQPVTISVSKRPSPCNNMHLHSCTKKPESKRSLDVRTTRLRPGPTHRRRFAVACLPNVLVIQPGTSSAQHRSVIMPSNHDLLRRFMGKPGHDDVDDDVDVDAGIDVDVVVGDDG